MCLSHLTDIAEFFLFQVAAQVREPQVAQQLLSLNPGETGRVRLGPTDAVFRGILLNQAETSAADLAWCTFRLGCP